MSTITVEELPTTGMAPLLDRHPRGRGFGILSRLARVEDVTGRHVLEGADEQTVVPFDRNRHVARHRRDDSSLLQLV